MRWVLFVSIHLSIVGVGTSKFRGFPRVRSDVTKRDESEESRPKDVFERCTGIAGFVPPQPFTSPDDSDNVTLILSPPAQWILRNSDFIPDPFLADETVPGYIHFCFEGDRKLFYLYDDSRENGSLQVDTPERPYNSTYVSSFHWSLVSVRDSPVKGNIIVDVRMCCLSLVYNVLYAPNTCNCDELDEDRLIISLHSVQFLQDPYSYCPECWAGLFTLCSSSDCNQRITSLQVNNQVLPLLPIVLTTTSEPLP